MSSEVQVARVPSRRMSHAIAMGAYVLPPAAIVFALRGAWFAAVLLAVLAFLCAFHSRAWGLPGSRASYSRRVARCWVSWRAAGHQSSATARSRERDVIGRWLDQNETAAIAALVQPLLERVAASPSHDANPHPSAAAMARFEAISAVRSLAREAHAGAPTPGDVKAAETALELARDLHAVGSEVVDLNAQEADAFSRRLAAMKPPSMLADEHIAVVAAAAAYAEEMAAFRDAYAAENHAAAQERALDLDRAAAQLGAAGERLRRAVG